MVKKEAVPAEDDANGGVLDEEERKPGQKYPTPTPVSVNNSNCGIICC